MQQDRLAAQTSEYLQAQNDRQSALIEQHQEMRRQMQEHRQYLEDQYRLLKAAEEAVGVLGQRLESLAQAGAAPPADSPPLEPSAVTVAAGTNLPVPPIYRGSSKKEKRDFMNSYAIYTRRIKALNQGTQANFFVMSLSACIEQGTMVQICGFELFKAEKDVTEAEWRDYFLSARVPDNTAYKTLDREVKTLCMDVELQDAESRLSRLMADFYEIVDRLNMEDIVQLEPKKVVGYLVEALRPQAFKIAVKDQLGRQVHKPTKGNIHVFVTWLRGELGFFMRFEAHIAVQQQSTSTSKAGQQQIVGHTAKKDAGGKKFSARTILKDVASTRSILIRDEEVLCPDVANPTEAKDLYEKATGRKVLKPVLTVATKALATVVSGVLSLVTVFVMIRSELRRLAIHRRQPLARSCNSSFVH
ncbi:hypothetical protein PC113_g12247 [Phytophthora cactorum]|uniref:Uncharacterized protein n=1 Tax=Phytophthora cactorum TaxID=29920 RepID=A0A8T0Z0Q1_9STRA|nr:hypothetical protein PC113_g12247 [Phytophthora cactorum]KAG2922042.1 hypothetical protein PC115_g9327 [Phytophthora cactorum]